MIAKKISNFLHMDFSQSINPSALIHFFVKKTFFSRRQGKSFSCSACCWINFVLMSPQVLFISPLRLLFKAIKEFFSRPVNVFLEHWLMELGNRLLIVALKLFYIASYFSQIAIDFSHDTVIFKYHFSFFVSAFPSLCQPLHVREPLVRGKKGGKCLDSETQGIARRVARVFSARKTSLKAQKLSDCVCRVHWITENWNFSVLLLKKLKSSLLLQVQDRKVYFVFFHFTFLQVFLRRWKFPRKSHENLSNYFPSEYFLTFNHLRFFLYFFSSAFNL